MAVIILRTRFSAYINSRPDAKNRGHLDKKRFRMKLFSLLMFVLLAILMLVDMVAAFSETRCAMKNAVSNSIILQFHSNNDVLFLCRLYRLLTEGFMYRHFLIPIEFLN